jgi:hypothetical protein
LDLKRYNNRDSDTLTWGSPVSRMLPKVAPYIHIYDATGKVSHLIIQDGNMYDKHSSSLGVARDNQKHRTIERDRAVM